MANDNKTTVTNSAVTNNKTKAAETNGPLPTTATAGSLPTSPTAGGPARERSPSPTTSTTVEINGGVLTRAVKTCECKVPDVKKNSIEEDDAWTCACGQGWRARAGQVFELQEGAEEPVKVDGIRWKKISTKPRKTRVAKPKTVPAATESAPAAK